jgi:hypothetical protein
MYVYMPLIVYILAAYVLIQKNSFIDTTINFHWDSTTKTK